MTGGPDPDDADRAERDRGPAEAEAEAADVLVEALADEPGRPPPEDALQAAASRVQDAVAAGDDTAAWLRRAAGLDADLRTPDGHRPVGGDLVLLLTAGSIGLLGDPGLDADDEAAVLALEPADWAAVVLGAVAGGPGTAADPGALVRAAEARPEIAGAHTEPGRAAVVAHALEVVAPAWGLLGLVDDDRRLTGLGAWALPRASCLLWGRDLDQAAPGDAGGLAGGGPAPSGRPGPGAPDAP